MNVLLSRPDSAVRLSLSYPWSYCQQCIGHNLAYCLLNMHQVIPAPNDYTSAGVENRDTDESLNDDYRTHK